MVEEIKGAFRINIGCGDRKHPGFINVDVCGDPDVRFDLEQFPWPFSDGVADEILAEHFLEHVHDYERTIFEIHRVLKPGGILHFKVPHFRSPYYPWHLHHFQFSTVTCQLLCSKIAYQFGGKQLFRMEKLRINYGLKKVYNCLFSFLANLSPLKWDWLGLPIEEIECVVRKV